MSNFVYGFVELKEVRSGLLAEIATRTVLGIASIPANKLHGFPPECMPNARLSCFNISDHPQTNVAEYLVDGLDYAPEAQIGLPVRSHDRLGLLCDVVDLFFGTQLVNRMFLAVTECCQIEDLKHVRLDGFRQTLFLDCNELCPPCCLYEILSN